MRENGCPLCGEDLPPGDVPFDDPHARSEAQMHIAACIKKRATGPMRRALDLLVWGDDDMEELFGEVDWAACPTHKKRDARCFLCNDQGPMQTQAESGLLAAAERFRGAVDEFFAGRRPEQFPEPNAHV